MIKMIRAAAIAALLFIFLLIADGCACNCGKSSAENTIKGYITVVGNEPFINLALQTDENKTYIIQCGKELKDELWKKQGSYYYVKYSELNEKEIVPTIVVENVIPFTKSGK